MSKYAEISRFIKNNNRARYGKPIELQSRLGRDKDYDWRAVERLLDEAQTLLRQSQEVSPDLYGKVLELYWIM